MRDELGCISVAESFVFNTYNLVRGRYFKVKSELRFLVSYQCLSCGFLMEEGHLSIDTFIG